MGRYILKVNIHTEQAIYLVLVPERACQGMFSILVVLDDNCSRCPVVAARWPKYQMVRRIHSLVRQAQCCSIARQFPHATPRRHGMM
jgi:hypothetical protein